MDSYRRTTLLIFISLILLTDHCIKIVPKIGFYIFMLLHLYRQFNILTISNA